jgi:hypothetical protein
MCRLLTALLLTAAFAPPVAALGDLAAFERIQSECVNVGDITFGPQGRWADCRVTTGRWFSTIGITDIYQAQYCLGSDGNVCTERALLLFSNRAYTPGAKMLFRRIDPGDTVYADPQVWRTDYGWIMKLEARRPEQSALRSYYLWQDENWQPIEAVGWQRELSRRLPAGVVIAGELRPDLDQMNAHVDLLRRTDGSTGSAEAELGIARGRLTVKKLRVQLPPGR